MTAALRAQLDAIGEQAVADALDTLRREHQERELDGRVLDVVTQTMQAAWAARNRLSLMAGEVGEHRYRPPMTAGRGRSSRCVARRRVASA